MTKAKIINFSALTHLQETQDVLPWAIGKMVPDLRRQWFSFQAYFELLNRYSRKPKYCQCFSTLNNLVWLAQVYTTDPAIPKFKNGTMGTDDFLNHLLAHFNFLVKHVLNRDAELVEKLMAEKDNLFSLRHFEPGAGIIPNELLAKALLEQAWVARMRFTEDSSKRIRKFMEDDLTDNAYIIANSNPLDMWHSVKYFMKAYPEANWIDADQLWNLIERPEQALMEGISLTKDGKIKLFVSYAHRAFKTGVQHETGMKTNNLIELLMEVEKLSQKNVMLVSQWPEDIAMAIKLKLEGCMTAEDYYGFKPVLTN